MEMLPNFFATIDQMGETNSERAKRLQMTGRALELWKSGKIPRLLKVLVSNPELLSAIAADAERAKDLSKTS